jgi:hypothetical protein
MSISQATVHGDFGSLVIERELLVSVDPEADAHCFASWELGSASYYLNGEPISEERARELLA